jgi:hypothetical protein
VGGRLLATAATGGITQSGAITTGADGSTFKTSTAGQAITLTSANVFGNNTVAFTTTGATGDVTVNSDALKFGATSVGGKLVATAATGGITQSGVLTMGANGSAFTTSAADQAINLAGVNQFGANSVAFNTAGVAGDVTVNSNALKFGTTGVGGKLVATAATGGITQNGAITTGANGSTFTTSTAAQAIDLGTSTNQFGANSVAFTTTGSADVTVSADALKFGATSVGGKLAATAATGGITQSGAITTGANGSTFKTSAADQAINLAGANLFGANSVAFSTAGVAGDVTVSSNALKFGATGVGG